MAGKTSKKGGAGKALLATTGKTSKQALLTTGNTARSEVRKAGLLLSQAARMCGWEHDVSLRETRERLIGQSMEALSNAEILASLEEEDARRAIAQETKTDPNAYQV